MAKAMLILRGFPWTDAVIGLDLPYGREHTHTHTCVCVFMKTEDKRLCMVAVKLIWNATSLFSLLNIPEFHYQSIYTNYEQDNLLKYLRSGTFFNINNVVSLLQYTLKNNSVCFRT